MRWTVCDTPIGAVSIAVDGGRVCEVRFGAVDPPRVVDPSRVVEPVEAGPVGSRPDEGLTVAVEQLRGYFAGELTEFSLPTVVRRGSDFERRVWGELARVPYGEMVTYGEVAAAVGDVTAARAVGVACNRNPLPIIVPCHRVVGAGGRLVGFGGGLGRKRYLLELEARVSLASRWGG